MCFLQYRGLHVWAWCGIQPRCRPHLSPDRIESILTTVKRVREGQSLTVKLFSKAVGSDDSCVQRDHFWPFQWWLRTTGFYPRGNPFCMIKVTRQCIWGPRHVEETVVPVTRPCVGGSMFLRNTNNGRFPHGLGSSHEWPLCPRSVGRSPSQVLKHFLPNLRGCHVLVRQTIHRWSLKLTARWGLRSLPLYRLALQILLWAQGKLLSLRAVMCHVKIKSNHFYCHITTAHVPW